MRLHFIYISMKASRGCDVKDCGLSAWLSFGSAEAIIPTTNRIPLHLRNPPITTIVPPAVFVYNKQTKQNG